MSARSVLIVEDELIVAADLSSKLTQLGYKVLGPVASGEEAVARARQERPGLVLMDIRLRGPMDGIEAALSIQELGLPVVFLTAHSDTATLSRIGKTGAFAYILKPYDDRELHAQIEMTLCKHAAEQLLREEDQIGRAHV